MGVDALMVVKTGKLSEKVVRDLAYDIAEAFGAGNFCTFRGKQYERRPLEILKDQEFYGVVADPDGALIGVNMFHRYYGPGYERGDLPTIIAVAAWLEIRIPGCSVFYGGDSDEFLSPFGPIERKEAFDYFARIGGGEYRNSHFLTPIWPQTCEYCERPMIKNGTGPSWESYHCPGCGEARSSKDGLIWSHKQPWGDQA